MALDKPTLPKKLRLLILEDSEADAVLASDELHQAGFDLDWVWVKSKPEFLARLNGGYDVMLSDYRLPQFNALEALHLLKERNMDIPFIVLTGSLGDETAAECIKQGATDYLLKDRLARLGPAVTRALMDRQLRSQREAQAIALRESEERLQIVVENLTEGLIISDLSGQLVHWNPAALEMHGFAEANDCLRHLAAFKQMFEVSSLDGKALPIEQWPLSRIVRGERLRNCELSVRRLDRDWQRIYSYGGSIVHDSAGKPMAFVTITDVTDRKQVEQALVAAEAKFRRLVEQSLVGIYLIQDDRFAYVNPKMTEIFGCPERELVTVPLSSLVHPDDRAMVEEKVRQRLTGETESAHYTLRMRHRSGAYIDVEARGSRTEYGGQPAIMGTMLDVTERRRAEQEAAWLASFPQRNPNPILELDFAGRVIHYANPAATRLFPELSQQPSSHPFLAGLELALASLLSDKSGIARREILVNGRYYLQTITRLEESQRVRIYASDITERRKAEDRIRSQLQELERWRDVTLDREERIQALKREVNELLQQAGQPPRYSSQVPGTPCPSP